MVLSKTYKTGTTTVLQFQMKPQAIEMLSFTQDHSWSQTFESKVHEFNVILCSKSYFQYSDLTKILHKNTTV